MFLGVMPSRVRNYVADVIRSRQPRVVRIPCAGNFTIERVVRQVAPSTVCYSTDVNLYSCALGWGLSANEETRIELTAEIREEFPWLRTDTAMERAASVVYLSELAQALGKRETPYYARLLKAAKQRGADGYEEAIAKITAMQAAMPAFRFTARDGAELIRESEPGDVIVFDPPSIDGGYERMYRALTACVSWDPPAYTDMDEAAVHALTAAAIARDVGVILLRYKPLEEEVPGLRLAMKHQFTWDFFWHVYTNIEADACVGRFSPLRDTALAFQLIDRETTITGDSNIELIEVGDNVANHYRMLWVRKARMKAARLNYIVAIDGRVAGCLCVASGMEWGHAQLLLVSDPACPGSQYRRLSKLLLYIASTQEFLERVSKRMMWDHDSLVTAVESEHPVSMKYRELFTLTKRVEQERGAFNYRLTYTNNDKILPTVQDGLRAWTRKHGKDTLVHV